MEIKCDNCLFWIDKTVYKWSLRYIEEGLAYELWSDGVLDLDVKFDDNLEQLPKDFDYYWKMKINSSIDLQANQSNHLLSIASLERIFEYCTRAWERAQEDAEKTDLPQFRRKIFQL